MIQTRGYDSTGVTRNQAGKSVYDIAFSPEYLAKNGFILWGFDETREDIGQDKIRATDTASFYSLQSLPKRLRCQAPMIDVVPHELGAAWGPLQYNQNGLLDSAAAKVPDSVKNLFMAEQGMSNFNISATTQMVDGYSFPEVSITGLLSYHFTGQGGGHQKYIDYINGLISVVSPRTKDTTFGNVGSPEGYIPPFFLNKYNTKATDIMAKDVPLNRMCAIQLGKHRLIRGLVVTGISLQPSVAVVYDGNGGYAYPAYMKVNIRAIGGRAIFDIEQAGTYPFNYKQSLRKGGDDKAALIAEEEQGRLSGYFSGFKNISNFNPSGK